MLSLEKYFKGGNDDKASWILSLEKYFRGGNSFKACEILSVWYSIFS